MAARRTQFTAFAGGLDLASSPMAKRPGRLDQGVNFEEVFGEQGYGFIGGYERFDGRAAASDADYSTLPFDAGTVAIAVADTVTNAGVATAEVVSVTLSSGSWAGGDAAGTLVLALVSGSWANNDAIKVGGVTKALAADETNPSDRSSDDYVTNMSATREYVRAKIGKVPGEGSVIGVAIYKAVVYAVRNAVGSLKAAMYKSSPTGWTLVRDGLIPNGAWKFKTANFSGNSTQLALFGVDGKNRLCKWDGTTFTKAAPIFGSEGTSTTNVTVGLGAKTWTIAQATRSWQTGDILVGYDTSDASISVIGTVTSYVSGTNTLNLNVTAGTSIGTASSAWEFGRADWTDKPFKLTSFKNYMMLAYPLGQLQTSDLGNPLTYTTTAALFGLGSELTGINSMRGSLLSVICREKISMLSGSSTTDWVMTTFSEASGAIDGTVADNIGNALYLDDIGVVSLQATQDFGSFQPAVLSRDVKKFLDPLISLAIGARMVRKSNQYRLYFSDGTVLRFTIISGNPVLEPKDVSPTRSEYDHVPTCLASGVLGDDAEAMFFGTTSGYLMREDSGTSFDGGAIDYVMRLPFDHYKSPAVKKRFHKLEFEVSCSDDIDFSFMQLFDYDDGNYGHSFNQTLETLASGGQFDVNEWDTFRFSTAVYARPEVNVSGVGRNMAILLVLSSNFASRAVLQGMTTHFTPLGIQR